jgi:hypothetical protein
VASLTLGVSVGTYLTTSVCFVVLPFGDNRMDPGMVIQWCGDQKNDAISICANSGVVAEVTDQPGGRRFIPRDDWRALTALELEVLSASRFRPLPDSVSIFRIAPRIRESFWANTAQAVFTSDPKIAPEERKKTLWACAESVVQAVSEFGITAKSLRSCDIQVAPSRSRSTSFDHTRGEFIGLHIDNHDKLLLGRRRDAFQLLCLNLGLAERHFQFVNLGIADLVAHLDADAVDAEARFAKAWQLTSDFFQKWPHYPVVRVTLPPNYGYIAVTQHVIHDGATNSAGHPDVALLLAGHFDIAGVRHDHAS